MASISSSLFSVATFAFPWSSDAIHLTHILLLLPLWMLGITQGENFVDLDPITTGDIFRGCFFIHPEGANASAVRARGNMLYDDDDDEPPAALC